MKTLENIRNSLFQKATTKFRLQTSGELDREKKLLLDWMAYELYGLHKELDNSRDYVQKNIASRLTPELSTRPVPEHLLVQAFPKKMGKQLKPGEDLFQIDRFGNQAPHEIYWSPVKPVKLVAAKVRWKGVGNTLLEVEEQQTSHEVAKTIAGQAFHPGVLWLGVDIPKEEQLPDQLIFHFDWETDEQRNRLTKLLPLIKWLQADQELKSEMGMKRVVEEKSFEKSTHLDAEYLHIHAIEGKLMQAYHRQFVTVDYPGRFDAPKLPEVLRRKISKEKQEDLAKKQIVWFKLVFPHGFKTEDISNVKIRLNCFPVINRKLDTSKDFTPSNPGMVEVKALSNSDSRSVGLSDSGDLFLGVDRIFSNKIKYKAVAFESFQEVPAGYYALQHGRVEASDFRDIVTRTEELVRLLSHHGARIKEVSGHEIQSALCNLEKGYQELTDLFNQTQPQEMDAGYYIHLKAYDPRDMIYVRFWLTQGVAAKGVASKGDFLRAERSDLEGGGVWVV